MREKTNIKSTAIVYSVHSSVHPHVRWLAEHLHMEMMMSMRYVCVQDYAAGVAVTDDGSK